MCILVGMCVVQSAHVDLQVMWGGGDPIYKDPKRGGNIADLAHALLKANYIKDVAAVQRIGYLHTSTTCCVHQQQTKKLTHLLMMMN